MKFFNGSMALKICEAHDLKPTDCSTRHQIAKGAQLIDPYISVDVDDNEVARTTTKTKTLTPVWNENFTTEVHNGRTLGLTVFHDAAIPPDDFVANCSIPFEEIKEKANDLWVCYTHIFISCDLRGEKCFGIRRQQLSKCWNWEFGYSRWTPESQADYFIGMCLTLS